MCTQIKSVAKVDNITQLEQKEENQGNNTFFEKTKTCFWLNNFCQPSCFENMKKDRHQFQITENRMGKSLETLDRDLG